MRTDVIYNGDCIQGLKRLPDNSVDLVVYKKLWRLRMDCREKSGGCLNPCELCIYAFSPECGEGKYKE